MSTKTGRENEDERKTRSVLKVDLGTIPNVYAVVNKFSIYNPKQKAVILPICKTQHGVLIYAV